MTASQRRYDTLRWTAAELALLQVQYRVEEMAADPRLTEVAVQLEKIRNLLADYVDTAEEYKTL